MRRWSKVIFRGGYSWIVARSFLRKGSQSRVQVLSFLHGHGPSGDRECEIQAFWLGTSFAPSNLVGLWGLLKERFIVRLHLDSLIVARIVACIVMPAALATCARLSISPQTTEHPDPVIASQAIETERFIPDWIEVYDFVFSTSSVQENASPLQRTLDWVSQDSAETRRNEVAADAAANLAVQTVKRLDQMGFSVIRIPRDDDVSMPGNNLIVTGRLIDVDEGNSLTRIAVGLGAGESTLDTEVKVYRVSHGERAEVLAFTTHADSGRMPGLAESMPLGVFLIGPITVLSTVKDTVLTGQKIYSTQMEYLASETGDQISYYLSQYAADESWIPGYKAKSVDLVAD